MISGKLSINLDFMFSLAHYVSFMVVSTILTYVSQFWSVFRQHSSSVLPSCDRTCTMFLFPPIFSGVFELNFMSNQPASGYYQFTVAVTGDSRLVANHVEVRWCLVA